MCGGGDLNPEPQTPTFPKDFQESISNGSYFSSEHLKARMYRCSYFPHLIAALSAFVMTVFLHRTGLKLEKSNTH